MTDIIQVTREIISRFSDEQVTRIAKSLNWKDAPADKLRGTLNLNAKTAKVQEAIQTEIDWISNDLHDPELEDPNTDMTEEEMEEAEKEDPDTGERIIDPDEEPAKNAAVSFGMNEECAAKYIEEEFGLTPRMAKRAVMRGINRDEYHGKGYVVKVVDTSEDSFDISVFAA